MNVKNILFVEQKCCQHIIHISKNLVKKKKYCILDQLKILKNKFISEKFYLIKVIMKLFWLKEVIQNLKLQLISHEGTTHLLSINSLIVLMKTTQRRQPKRRIPQ